jgi:hypothetical protein
MSLLQSFGGSEIPSEADTITSVEYDDTGNYIATADAAGRLVVFRSSNSDINDKVSTHLV